MNAAASRAVVSQQTLVTVPQISTVSTPSPRRTSSRRQALERRIPAGRLGPLSQLAGTYLYLASPLSDYVTGQSITVDGGWQVG